MNPTTLLLHFLLTALLLPALARAEFSLPAGSSSPGHGLSNVLTGTIANGALYWQSTSNWLNTGNPPKPYAVTNEYPLPVCDSIAAARIVATIWGGTANFVSEMTVTVNGTNLPAASPLIFGSTSDSNFVFSAVAPSAYGSGSGVWLVTIPVPPEMLFGDGTPNTVVLSQDTADAFDGRVQHVTFLAVYQQRSLSNMFSYSVAEGSGDLYKTPTGSQVARRTVAFAPVDPAHARAATLHLLYTYGDANHDRLYFNDQLYGTDNIADWNTAERNNGPSVVTFQVLSDLAISNTVTISLGPEVPAPQETSLRPQLAVLTVTRPASIPDPVLGISNGGTLVWTTNSVGYSLESTTNLVAGDWAVLTNNPAVSDAQFTLPLDHSSAIRFYRLRKAN